MPGVLDQYGYIKVTTAPPNIFDIGLCSGRLTLTSGTPVTLSDETAKTTVYFTPYEGNQISIYDGSSAWAVHEFAEKSVAVPATTGTPFDVFGYISGGVLALQTVNWTNDTTRATAIASQDGIYVKSGATDYRYLGTGRTTGVSGQTENSFLNRYLWNYYNRVSSTQVVTETTSHTYGGAAWRTWNNDTSTRLHSIIGVAEEYIFATVTAQMTGGAGLTCFISIGINGVASGTLGGGISPGATLTIRSSSSGRFTPALGLNFLQAIEYGAGVTPTFALVRLDTMSTR